MMALLEGRSVRRALWPVVAAALVLWSVVLWSLGVAAGQTSEISEWLAPFLASWPLAQAWLREAGAQLEPMATALVWGLWGAGAIVLLGSAALGAWLLGRPARN